MTLHKLFRFNFVTRIPPRAHVDVFSVPFCSFVLSFLFILVMTFAVATGVFLGSFQLVWRINDLHTDDSIKFSVDSRGLILLRELLLVKSVLIEPESFHLV